MSFPKSILLKLDDNDGDPVLIAAETVDELAEQGQHVVVGRYKLIGTGVVHTYADYVEDEKP
jgi:hypothetical protein